MSPYLAPDLTMKSLDDLDSLAGRTYNIIYPVLDLLDEARRDLGHVPKIDAVLMNGGMSKLFAVRERIRDFFGFEPLEAGDPDLAVARGASVYHYWKHLGIKTRAGTLIDIQAYVDDSETMSLRVWNPDSPYESYTVENIRADRDEAYTPHEYIAPPGGFMAGIMTLYGKISDRAARMLGRLARASDPHSTAMATKYLEALCMPSEIRDNIRECLRTGSAGNSASSRKTTFLPSETHRHLKPCSRQNQERGSSLVSKT